MSSIWFSRSPGLRPSVLVIIERISRAYCDGFKKRGETFENIYIRKESERLLRELRKQNEAKRYQKQRDQMEEIRRKYIEEQIEQEQEEIEKQENLKNVETKGEVDDK